MSEEKIIVKSKQSSLAYLLVDVILIGMFIGWVSYVSGCEECKNTGSGTECFAKSVGSLYKELNEGFNKGLKNE